MASIAQQTDGCQQTMPPLILTLLLLLLASPSAATYTVSTGSGAGNSDKHQPQKQQQQYRPHDPSWLETAITGQQPPADRNLAPPRLVNVKERGQAAESATTGAAASAATNPTANANRPSAEAKSTDGGYGRKWRRQDWEKSGSGQQQQKQQKQQKRKQSPQVESVKSEIIGDFVRQHGDAIRRSRRHADLFDGSGYLIDLMEELNEYESRADEHREKERQRRSANGDKEPPPPPEEQSFASLSDALEHLNGGQQFEVASDGLNVRFEADVDFEDEDNKDHSSEKRQRRSADKDEDDNDDDERVAHDDAASSLERLDETLAELARYLDELAADEAAAASAEAASSPLEQYRRSMTEAYGSLAQLRGVAQGLLSKHHQPQQKQQQQQRQHNNKQPPRMAGLFLDKAADWQMNAEALTENVRQLERLYRQADEL